MAAELIATYLELPESATEGLVLCNGELPPEHSGEKSCRLDLLASMKGRMVNLELQYGHSEDFFMRNLFTLSRIIGIHTKRSDSYGSIPKINLINLIDFSFERIKRDLEAFLGALRATDCQISASNGCQALMCPAYPIVNVKDKGFHKTIHFCTGEALALPASSATFHYIELGNVPPLSGEVSTMSRKATWSNFFKIKSKEDFERMYLFKSKKTRKALNEMRNVLSDEAFAYHLLTIEKGERDIANKMYHAKAEGRAEGIAEGRAEGRARGKAEAASLMLASKFPDCPASFLEHVESSTDIEWLNRIFTLALKCSCWEELKALVF